jgi:hypothetical protein
MFVHFTEMSTSFMDVGGDLYVAMGNIHSPNLPVKVFIKNLITCPDKASFSEHFVL